MTPLPTIDNACQCNTCKSACERRPGWFMPGEAEKAAELLGMTKKEFFDKYLGIDWWEGSDPIFLLAPATHRSRPGQEYPSNPRGACVLFKDGLCSIHAAKPHECRIWSCKTPVEEGEHEQVAMAWRDHQAEIVELLGREPMTKEYTAIDDIIQTLKWGY